MRKVTLTIILACVALAGMAQNPKYYKVYFHYVTECNSGDATQIIKGELTYEQIRYSAAKWMAPNKLKQFYISGFYQIGKAEYSKLAHTVKFRCTPVKRFKISSASTNSTAVRLIPDSDYVPRKVITTGAIRLDTNRMDTTWYYNNGKWEKRLIKPVKTPKSDSFWIN